MFNQQLIKRIFLNLFLITLCSSQIIAVVPKQNQTKLSIELDMASHVKKNVSFEFFNRLKLNINKLKVSLVEQEYFGLKSLIFGMASPLLLIVGTFAINSIMLSIFIFGSSFILGIAALILSIKAIKYYKTKKHIKRRKWMAITGLILGSIMCVFFLIYLSSFIILLI